MLELARMELFVFKKYESEGIILPTTKLFYDKYPFKVRCITLLPVIGYRWVFKRSKSQTEFVEKVKCWYDFKLKCMDGIRIDEVIADTYDLLEFVNSDNRKFKSRAEGNTLDIYTETEAELCEVTKSLIKLTSAVTVKSIWKPTATIEKGIILVKGTPKFLYKATVKSYTKFSIEEKEAVFKYLTNFPESEVKLTRTMSQSLQRSNHYSDGYFYLNDLSIITFITLISPSFVNKIFDLVEMKG